MQIIENIRYAENENNFLDIILPEVEEFDLMIWFHGGCLTGGSRKDVSFAKKLIQKGVALVSADYRLYPDCKFPDFIMDAAKVVKYTLDHISDYGNIKRIYVAGSSAGAYLTLMLAFDNHYLLDVGVDPVKITGYLSESAQTTTHFSVLAERGVEERLERIDPAAPLYHVGEKTKFGELLLIYYADDIPCRPEQNKLLYQSLKRLCPEQNAKLLELPGEHVSGTTIQNDDGSYDFTESVIRFLNI